jgi:signal transduction histidine kinase
MRMLLVSSVAALALATAGVAAEMGTPEEAQAMLERAVDAIKSDRDAALEAITAGDPQFKDRDLYVFCGGEDGAFSAHGANAQLVGQDMRALKDKADQPLGEKIYEAGVEGEMNTVEYMWPRPGETEPSQKVSYVTKVEDQTCGVGYYK